MPDSPDQLRERVKKQSNLLSVYRLRQEWLTAGPPPLGTSVSRWWDQRLVELGDALAEAIDLDTTKDGPGA